MNLMMLRPFEVWTIRQVCLSTLELAFGQAEYGGQRPVSFPKPNKETSLIQTLYLELCLWYRRIFRMFTRNIPETRNALGFY